MKKKDDWIDLGTSVSPEGRFVWALHQPRFHVRNLRRDDFIETLGRDRLGTTRTNAANFPPGDVQEAGADPIFEVANPLPFRGTTYIGKAWADAAAADPTRIAIAPPSKVSLERSLKKSLALSADAMDRVFSHLPDPVRLALATTSTDPNDLKRLAEISCEFVWDTGGARPVALVHATDARGQLEPKIFNHRLFEAVANNPHLPDAFKEVMVLRPGIQGGSEIVGQWRSPGSHVFEYLRRNSYIPWGHYAANMAHDAIRYAAGDLSAEDTRGLRHLYYQRTYARLAQELNLALPAGRRKFSFQELETLRQNIVQSLEQGRKTEFTATLWGWNYGFDYAPSGYRLHASHQQIHQQFALVPEQVPLADGDAARTKPAYACGDMIHTFAETYGRLTGADFFACYEKALTANKRMDGSTNRPAALQVYADDRVMLFVPKAQTSQWELQLMPLKPVGNIIEADEGMRQSLDRGLLIAMRILAAMGAAMITVFEYNKRIHRLDSTQRLLYVFLPRLPESPGAFSEAQLRWINGHYPEDFALACRLRLESVLMEMDG
jgi:hypothetical protein